MNTFASTVERGIATLHMHDAATSNAIDIDVVRAIHHALDGILTRQGEARAVIITGGDDVFCSGIDLHTVDTHSPDARQGAHFEMRRFMNHLIERLSGFPLPIIAAVNGAAVEAGMSLALACDIIVASENAYFTPSFAHLGLVPDPGITFHLPRSIGTARSLSSMLLSEKIDAQTAPEWGLVYAVVPRDEVLSRAMQIAERLMASPSVVLAQIRALHAQSPGNSLTEQLRAEQSAQEMRVEIHDFVEGVRAFFDKREPHFTDHR
jgi:2-(1,2-epoxy-1,2-dihydrophenyl)acetyl-CoA isomerase